MGSIRSMKKAATKGQKLDEWEEKGLQAVFSGHLEIVEMLLDAGADIDHQNCNGNCPLEEAVSLGDEKMIELLLKRGANPNVQSVGYDTVLNQSIYEKHFRIAELLLECGASVEPIQLTRYKPDEVMSEPPLVIAAERGERGLVKQLLDKGADVNAESRFDGTALDVAERKTEKNLEIIDLLRSHGAKITSKGEANGNSKSDEHEQATAL